jgi:hypothetical protein
MRFSFMTCLSGGPANRARMIRLYCGAEDNAFALNRNR